MKRENYISDDAVVKRANETVRIEYPHDRPYDQCAACKIKGRGWWT